MQRTPELFEKIEGYLAGTLSSDLIQAFEKEMAASIWLQEEVEKHRMLHNTLKDQDTLAFRNKIQQISATAKGDLSPEVPPSAKKKTAAFYLKIAASVIVIVGLGTFLWHMAQTKRQTQNLYAAYYSSFPVEDAVRGTTGASVEQIVKSYARGSYDSVVMALEKHPDLNQKQPLPLYLGNSYLQTDQEEKAIHQFKDVSSTGKYFEAAQWYLSLTYLKINNPKKAITLLQEIVTYKGTYGNKAAQLLKALKK